MKKINKLKLSNLSKDSLEKKELSRLYGSNLCMWGDDNRDSNESSGKCSCMCDTSDYYAPQGLDLTASFYKDTAALGYC